MSEEVETLIEKAASALDSGDAMRYSQAACNAANALAVLNETEIRKNSPTFPLKGNDAKQD